MKISSLLSAAALMLFAAPSFASESENFKLIHVADLVADMQSGHPIVYDANGKETRQKDGIIPGAKLLPGLDYSVATELPTDKSADLVFYCANTKCMASHIEPPLPQE